MDWRGEWQWAEDAAAATLPAAAAPTALMRTHRALFNRSIVATPPLRPFLSAIRQAERPCTTLLPQPCRALARRSACTHCPMECYSWYSASSRSPSGAFLGAHLASFAQQQAGRGGARH